MRPLVLACGVRRLRGVRLVACRTVCVGLGGLCGLSALSGVALGAGVGQGPAKVAAVAGGGQVRERLAAEGLVLRELRWDPVLRRSWAIFANPAQPERPAVAVPAQPAESGVSEAEFARRNVEAQLRRAVAQAPTVHAGDRVRLWSAEKNLRLQLTAVAQEDGAVGDHIRLRIPGGWAGDTAEQALRGVVRGLADVEMEQ